VKKPNRKTRNANPAGDVFIALYRGINVGGNNAVKMAALCSLHERLGHTHVRHYIQSGNIVFIARGDSPSIAKTLATAFEKQFGFPARVVLLTAEELVQIAAQNPYAAHAAANPKSVHAAICVGVPDEKALNALLKKCAGPESFTLRNRTVYLHAPDGIGNSKFAAAMEKAAAVPMTARNWRTIEALCAMIRG